MSTGTQSNSLISHSRLAFCLFLWHALPDLLRYEIVPLQLPTRAFVHSRLERPQLRDSLQLLNSIYRLLQEVDIRVAIGGFFADRFEGWRVLLQML